MSYILFGTINTKTDCGFMTAPYEIPLPKAQTAYVTVPGRDGTLDLSEGFGTVRYADRTITVALYAVGNNRQNISSFVNAVHGKRMNITFSKDPLWYYAGRVNVSSVAKSDGYSTLTVQITASPYKRKLAETSVTVTGNGTATLTNSRMPVVPRVTTTAAAVLEFPLHGETARVELTAGTHTVPSLELSDSETKQVSVTSQGTTTFTYREGAL